MQNLDYGWKGYYFISIVTKNREWYFGEIEDRKMALSNIGIIADILWHEIKNHAPNIELDEFIVMPNHTNGIIIINNFDGKNDKRIDENRGDADSRRDNACVVPQKTIGQKRFQNQGENTMSSIIGSYKSAVSKHTHHLGYDFNWQSRFHDHLIRDKAEYFRIKNNPLNWNEDKFH